MSTKPIDYAAMASQARGVDYAALANQARQTDSAQSSTSGDQGFLSSFAGSSGLSGLGHAIAHPIDTAMGIPFAISSGVKGAIDNAHQEANLIRTKGLLDPETRRKLAFDVPIAGPAIQQAEKQHLAGNDTGVAGTLLGTVAGVAAPQALKGVIPAIGRGAVTTGAAAEDAGVGVMNKTIGTLKNDFKRGANPGKAYLDAGGTPSLSMAGLAEKGAALKSSVGAKIPALIDGASGKVIPVPEVASRLAKPIAKGIDLETGPGGLGNTSSIENYSAGFRPTIAEGVQNGGYTPRQVFDLKRGIADNTNWSDPSQFNLKSIRQQQVGSLSGLLSDNIPGLSEVNGQYAGLKNFSARAGSRAETGSMPFTSLVHRSLLPSAMGAVGGFEGGAGHALAGAGLGLALDSVPVKSALGYGLYQGGKLAQGLGARLATVPPFNPAAVAIPTYSLIRKKGDDANQ